MIQQVVARCDGGEHLAHGAGGGLRVGGAFGGCAQDSGFGGVGQVLFLLDERKSGPQALRRDS